MNRLGIIGIAVASAVGLAWVVGGWGLVTLAAVSFAVQWVAFPLAYAASSERYYDLTGSFTYLVLLMVAIASTERVSPRALVLAICVTMWALRLGLFLAHRVHKAGRDRRFDEIKHSASRFAVAWSLQGLWVFLTPLAVWIVIAHPVDGLGPVDAVGVGLWAFGFGVEVLADVQKSAFRSLPENSGRFIQSGLWAWSRHPNYFGEILLWIGVFVAASAQLQGVAWLSVLSPVFVAALLIAGSGIPLLEAQADKRWSDDPEYSAYKARTPVLIPFLG